MWTMASCSPSAHCLARRPFPFFFAAAVALVAGMAPAGPARAAEGSERGEFEGATEVGEVHAPGSEKFDAQKREYRITGAGQNMWAARDGFHYLWRKASGDLILTSAVRFAESKGNQHRKAGWVVRQNLEADGPYADAIVHADGLVSLQYRLVKGGTTLELRSPWKMPPRGTVRLERTGDLFTLWVAGDGTHYQPVGSVSVPLGENVYAGLGVCAHEANAMATAVISQVGFENPGVIAEKDRVIASRLEVISVPAGERRVVYETREHIEAPNWSRDGKSLIYNSAGNLYTIAVRGGTAKLIDTGSAHKLNNDHGLSRDGKWVALSHQPADKSLVYVMPAKGGEPRLVTALGPSYWHGWSPDGKTLAYCANRNNEFDIYTIPASAENSSAETRLTTAPGLDDGPDFSPDGKTIFFNSERTGLMSIFRMNADGSDQSLAVKGGEFADWFPHPSPDGKWLVFLSFDKSIKGHPPNKDVALRLMPLPGGEPKVLTRLFGGQGTINVPSWSPDSRQVAFVSYHPVKK
jgi:TolB protein